LSNPYKLHRLGTILIWAGVLVWAPYFILRMFGENPSLMMYLPFHLIGVIGGGRLRLVANKQLGKKVEKRKGYKLVAHLLVIASLLVWIPYYALKLTGNTVELTPYLTVHLIGIFSGTGLMSVGAVMQFLKKRRQE
jgi:hypothetical protein